MSSRTCRPVAASAPRFRSALCGAVAGALALLTTSCGKPPAMSSVPYETLAPGVEYANQRMTNVPWSVHVVRFDRTDPAFEVRSVHAGQGALGLATLTDQIQQLPPGLGAPVGAVNGDFYQRDRAYAGDPRGLQILDGDLVSAPVGGVAFWPDAAGQLHVTNVVSRLQVAWPDGTTTSFGVNQDRAPDALVLFTPAIGASTRTTGGREWVLEAASGAASAILAPGSDLQARVVEVRDADDTATEPGRFVLSAGPQLLKTLPKPAVGSMLRISTATIPALRDVRTALSGGPVLVRDGKALKIEPPASGSYEFSSMTERHPRSAIGWDARHFYLVEVDGRQEHLSVGMTLEELAEHMAGLGCTDAMNLDGGGSATLWCAGKIRNSPCDGRERPIANALVVMRKPSATAGSGR